MKRKMYVVDSERERIPSIKPSECRASECVNFTGQSCLSRLELLTATGDSAYDEVPPYKDDCNYAKYGQVCTGGDNPVVVHYYLESPNREIPAAAFMSSGYPIREN